jgi:hypothetical protein
MPWVLDKYCGHHQLQGHNKQESRTMKGYRHIHNWPKGFQKLFSLPFLVAFLYFYCVFSKRSSLLCSKNLSACFGLAKKPFCSFWMDWFFPFVANELKFVVLLLMLDYSFYQSLFDQLYIHEGWIIFVGIIKNMLFREEIYSKHCLSLWEHCKYFSHSIWRGIMLCTGQMRITVQILWIIMVNCYYSLFRQI